MNMKLCSRCKENPAVMFISKIEGDKTTQEGLCLKCAREMNIGPIKDLLDKFGISDDDIDSASQMLGGMFGDDSDDSDDDDDTLAGKFKNGGAPSFPFFGGLKKDSSSDSDDELDAEIDDESEKKEEPKSRKKSKKRKFLDQFCTNLTEKAANNKIDNIIGRDEEIARTIQILCRRTKNNPCLIGEPGVGKTAIAEGIALKIANGDVPAQLRNKEVHLLDLTALVAGTQFRGQFESRIKGLIEEVKKEKNIILFIDEVHTLVGAGGAEGSMNAANILKPALSRGEVQVIGATTFNEYRKHIEDDAALERRFQPVKVGEPSIAEAYEILKGIKSYYENFHKVTVDDKLLYKIVSMSERYITERYLPDKAIDMLDEACTCANLRNKAISEYQLGCMTLEEMKEQEASLLENSDEGNIDFESIARMKSDILVKEQDLEELRIKAEDNAVREEDLARVISLSTGIPVSKIMDSDMHKLSSMEENIKQHIIGQDEAVSAVCAAIRRSRVRLTDQKRPASFIFVGPTGVGKTELVKRLSQELFDTPETLIRFDMSEFMEKHSVSRLIGSPPGYVGYDEAGQLTEKVRRRPYSVVLFDEIEKAHPDVMNILLQILDEGKTNDAQGRTVSFENTVIVMTSNAGSNNRESVLGFGTEKAAVSKDKAMKGLREFLRPEFIGRVDEIIVFNSPTEENYIEIAKLCISEISQALRDRGTKLSVADEVYPLVAKNAVDGQRGARDIRHFIRKNVEDPITNILISHFDELVEEIHVSAVDDKIIVE